MRRYLSIVAVSAVGPLTAACGDSGRLAEHTGSESEALEAGPPPTFSPRNACLPVGGVLGPGVTLFANATTPMQDGIPTTQPPSTVDCVETGHSVGGAIAVHNNGITIASGNTIVVDVDNPRIFTQPTLASVSTMSSGTVDQEALQQVADTTYQWADFTFSETLGDTAPPGFAFGGGSVAETLSVTPQSDGLFSPSEGNSSFPGKTIGARVGYSNLRTQMNTVGPSAQPSPDIGLNLHLNPQVLLIPIQTIAILGDTVPPPPNSDVATQLLTFDRVQTCSLAETTVNGDGPATNTVSRNVVNCGGAPAYTLEQKTIVREAAATVVASDGGFVQQFHTVVDNSDGTSSNSEWGYVLPDDIWAQCGIQFRLVKHFGVKVDDFDSRLPGEANNRGMTDDAPFFTMENAVVNDPQFLKGVPAVMIPTFCTFNDSQQQDEAQTSSPFIACASGQLNSLASGVQIGLAHELGHSIGGLRDATISPDSSACLPGFDDNLMCASSGGINLTPTQCQMARAQALSIITALQGAKPNSAYFPIAFDNINFETTTSLVVGAQAIRAIQAGASGARRTTGAMSMGNNGSLDVRTFQSPTWGPATALSAAGFAPATASVVVAQQTSTQTDAFIAGNDGKVYMTAQVNSGAWSALTALTAASFATPGAILTTATQGGQLGVFLIDKNGKLEVIWWDSIHGWQAPVALTAANYAPAGSALAAGTRASGELDLFSVGSDGALKYMFHNLGIWGGPLSLTVTNFAPPGATVATALDVHGFLNVMTVGNDGALYTKWDATPLWSGPTALTATGFAPPNAGVSAINFNNNSLNAFLVDNNGGINVLSNAGTSWQGPTTIAQYAAAPGAQTSAAVQGTNELDLFIVSGAAGSGVLESINTGAAWSSPVGLP